MKILLIDIETSFKLAGVWGRWDQNIAMNQIFQDTYVLCWSAKWLGEKGVQSDALHHHSAYKKDPTDDTQVLKTIWHLLDQADLVIAHNGAKFDVPVLNSRFIEKGLPPPSPFRVIDTLKVAKRAFKFTSNRLDDLGALLKLGRKLKHDGFDLWRKVIIDDDPDAFNHMVQYCKQDVVLLEKVYLALRPWDKVHPNVALKESLESKTCPVCKSTSVKKNGVYSTNTQTFQAYRCTACNHNLRSPLAHKRDKDKKHNLLRSV